MNSTPTGFIVESLTRLIVEHSLQPGEKLVEQKLADQFGVSRTLIRQALFKLSQNRLVRMVPARGAFVSAPSVTEAKQVFAVRRILESGMTRSFMRQATAKQIKALKAHIAEETAAIQRGDVATRTTLLGNFHVRMAELMGNEVLASLLNDLISRCALITLMYQSSADAEHSHDEHAQIVAAIESGDEEQAIALMDDHLKHVEEALTLQTPPEPSKVSSR
jgi:DNA-binding GntR family transcriptional regulator